MLKIVKVGGLAISAGVLIGGGAVVWLRLHPADAPVVSSRGGSVVLDTGSTPSPSPDNAADLHVSSPSSVAAAGGNAGSLLGAQTAPKAGGASTGAADSSSATPAPSSSVPSPADFGQYDKYADDQAALFGDEVVGNGAAVAAGSTVAVYYRGWLTNGTLFDESITQGKPFVFKEGDHAVISGWEEGLLGMKAGGTRRLIVPPSVGYGAAGRPPGIPPNSVLVFDIELVAVQ